MRTLSSATLNAHSGMDSKTHGLYYKHKTPPWSVASTVREAQAGGRRVGQRRTHQCSAAPPSPKQGPPGVKAGEKEVSTTRLFTLQVALSAIPSTNMHLLLSLWQAQSQAPTVDEEGQSPHAPCPQAFTVQKGRETQNWVGGRGGGEAGWWSGKAS